MDVPATPQLSVGRAGDAVAPLKSVDEITTSWFTEALQVQYPGVEVTSVHLGPVRHGSESTVRVLLDYNRAGHEQRLPATMFVKGQLGPRALEGSLGWRIHTEARFYQDVAPLLPGLNIPGCFFATVGADERSTFLMEDLLARNAILASAGTTVTAATAYRMAEQLAQLHALWFDAPELTTVDWLAGTSVGTPDIEQMAAEESGIFGSFKEGWWARRTQLPHCEFLPTDLLDRNIVKRALVAKYREEGAQPLCLIHGDPHLGNMFFSADGTPGLYDWSPMAGRWGNDLNYAIVGSLDVEDRREHEQPILRHYLHHLALHGGPQIAWDAAWLSWRRQTIHGFMYMLCSPRQQPEDLIALQTLRFGWEAIDNDLLAALDV
ncbi:MAG: phosphotransferase [Actinomycetota bacterium]|nr:phosphotransferase [Actinomycetota bacterium]